MLQPIRATLCAHTRLIIFWAVLSLVVVHLSAPSAGDTAERSATMVDIVLYMNSLKCLPDYCRCRLAITKFREEFRNKHKPAQIDWPAQFAKACKKWVRIIGGKNWRHLHHYSFGIQKLNLALRMTERSNKEVELRRKGTLKGALEEFEYMRRGATPTFPLWSQLFMYESQIYFQLGQPVKAQRAMQQGAKYQKRHK